MLHPKTDEHVNLSVEVHHLVGKLSAVETLLTEVQRKVLVINVCNQRKTLCSPCMFRRYSDHSEGLKTEELWHESMYDQDLLLQIANNFNGLDSFLVLYIMELRQLGVSRRLDLSTSLTYYQRCI